jgi:hypothetical protein
MLAGPSRTLGVSFDEGSCAKETSCFLLSILYAVCGGVSGIKLQG